VVLVVQMLVLLFTLYSIFSLFLFNHRGDYVVLGDFALIRFFQIEFIFRLINYQTKSEVIN